MQFKWLQIFCLCAAIQFQFIEGQQNWLNQPSIQPRQEPRNNFMNGNQHQLNQPSIQPRQEPRNNFMNGNQHQPYHASNQPIQGPGTGGFAMNNNQHQHNQPSIQPIQETRSDFMTGNQHQPSSTLGANSANPQHRGPNMGNNNNNNFNNFKINANRHQGATNNQGFAPASDTSSSIVPGHRPEEESNNFNHNHDQTQQQHIETTTYPYSSQGSNNQGVAQQHPGTSTTTHPVKMNGNNYSGSHSTSHICTRTTERYDCQFQNVHLKEGNTSVFGSQDLNTQQRLTFVDSSLEYLPKSLIDAFPNVIMLNLNDLKIASIQSNALERAEKLQSMFVANNRLFQIDPYAFSGANNLQILVLSNNEIKLIDNLAFNSNTGLHYLYLDQNQLDKLPSFTNNVKLQFLNASHNKLSLIDDGHFRQLKNLHTLDLSFNRLGRLNLQQLNAYPLELVDVSSNDLTDFVMPTYVITLNARNNSLREFAVGQQCTLRKVDLSRNKLETQPKFKNCGSLEHLDLSHNLLEEFVYNESMEKLQTINLAHNNLFDIQLKIKTKTFARSLKKLDLSHNRLTHISSLNAFNNLEWLYLNNNKLIGFKTTSNSIKGYRMANNEWSCNEIQNDESKTMDKNDQQCTQEQMKINGICCRYDSKPYNDRLNKVLREADFHERENQKKCPKPVSDPNNQNTNRDEIRNAMANADTGRREKLNEIDNVTAQKENWQQKLKNVKSDLSRLTTSKVNVAHEIENQRKSHRVTKEGLISDKVMLARIIKFVQERDAFNKDLLSRRKKDTEESKGLFDEKQRKFDELKQTIEKLKDDIISLKKEEKKQKREKDLLEKKVNKNSASIHGSSGTISK